MGIGKGEGELRDVVVRNNNNNKGRKLILGTRTTFVFYLGNSLKTAVRTEWFMHEYALIDHVKSSYVLCRVFIKSPGGNSMSEVGLSSGAEESVSAVHHIHIQREGIIKPDIVEANVHADNSFDRRNSTSRYPVRLLSQLDDHAISASVSDTSFHFPTGIAPNDQVSTPGLAGDGIFSDAVAAQQFQSILEEDFIELDDLVH